MAKSQEPVDSTTLIELPIPPTYEIEIPEAGLIRLQRLDLARHAVIAPDNNSYVVATFDDTRLGHGYMTIVYPQQNGYLTLVLLSLYQHSSATPQEAIKHHVEVAQAIQQGRLDTIRNR